VLETIGVEPEFWNIFPETSMLDGRDFEDLSFKQRVWLLKTVCDTIMHTRKTVQEDMMNQSWQDQFETVLGIDRNGTRYIYFPQFMPNDFRIYRHSLDNKILSTVRPVRQERESERNKFMKYRKRKLQIRNSLSDRRSNKHENRNDDKDLSNNDSTTGSFISEDTNLSSTSTCSNNNNISLDVINRKHRRSLSKMSEESLQSNARSSGYDTNTSSDNKFIDDESSQMFKGFINTPNENCNIEIINEMLDDLKTEIDEEKRINGSSSSSELASQEDFVEYKSTAVFRSETVVEKDENERLSDNLSNSSKTDDEKLNEIINAESLKLPEDVYSKSISASDNVSDISTLTSKSDDEKLNETKASNSSISINENNLNKVIFNKLFGTSSSINNVSLDEEVSRENCSVPEMQSVIEAELNDPSEKNLRTGMKLRSQKVVKQYDQKNKTEATKVEIKEKQELKDVQVDETEEENFSISEMRLQTNMEYDLDDYINNTDVDYNLQRSKSPKTDECKQRFNKMLSDLSVSDFNLVADSVEGLRDLVALFTANNSESKNSNNAEIVPLCEVKLVKKMTELLNSLEPAETTIKDAMRKAKAKLQREWTNFKEGSVEDQDSSGEGGLSSNWWVLGSQGKDPLSATPGDATLQTLSQSALSPLGTQNAQKQSRQVDESEHEGAIKDPEQNHHESREASDERRNEGDKKQSDVEAASGENQVAEERERHGESESASNDEDAKRETQHSRRVLRARGISSYTEQLYSDDESDENELEEWTDVEAVYAAPSTQTNTPASHVDTKDRNSSNWSEEEDSDQDWILPSSRKRKNKRSSTNRRLKRRVSQTPSAENSGQKVTSLIMLSDSDDEIEMIVMEKTPTTSAEKATPANRARLSESQRAANQSRQKPTITSDITVPSTKGILSPQIIQRMSQGGISITPVKNNPPSTTNANTQLVVVVNETGSHYALALPNGSKLILTPEQVAQIRASNGGKLIL
ncbi:PREDICTED: putative uncharacterized protein DDB_G0287457, partial [Vollenhovia emeryi]|uniref:putative uncharacterized protein DDB_G0287457 n=1 Tax=Vollenhovia emeryi TaxID=411798 RepID=UPI0005F484D2